MMNSVIGSFSNWLALKNDDPRLRYKERVLRHGSVVLGLLSASLVLLSILLHFWQTKGDVQFSELALWLTPGVVIAITCFISAYCIHRNLITLSGIWMATGFVISPSIILIFGMSEFIHVALAEYMIAVLISSLIFEKERHIYLVAVACLASYATVLLIKNVVSNTFPDFLNPFLFVVVTWLMHLVFLVAEASILIAMRREFESRLEVEEQTRRHVEEQRQRAVQADRLKTEFLANVTHELRTPLNGILGSARLLNHGMVPKVEEQQKMLRTITVTGENLLALVNQLLDMSKINAGMLDFENVEFPVVSTVQGVVDGISSLAVQKNLELVFEAPEEFEVIGDGHRISQIVRNLLANAIKFTRQGSVKIAVNCLSDAWEIVVEDTGVGIPKEALTYIFDPFTQVDGTHTREFGGTGLGLTIVHKLVTAMKGSIVVDSELGKGTKITVAFPLKKAEVVAESLNHA